ncbi:MAG: restriction endonuclease [Phycisphaerae bacterium]
MNVEALTLQDIIREAREFSEIQSALHERDIYGVTDGKAVGTLVEHKFQNYLAARYSFARPNSASGVDFPSINLDIKVTSVVQPQSSSPFRSARQKIFGLGYHLLVFVYEKVDNSRKKTSNLFFRHTIFLDQSKTADFQITKGLRQLLKNKANEEELAAYIMDKNLPVDSIELAQITSELIKSPPEQGYLTISNALQWRLQYQRVIEEAGQVDGIIRVR